MCSLLLKPPLRTLYHLVSVTRILSCLILGSENNYLIAITKMPSPFSNRTRVRRKLLGMCSWSKFTSSAMPVPGSPGLLAVCCPVHLSLFAITIFKVAVRLQSQYPMHYALLCLLSCLGWCHNTRPWPPQRTVASEVIPCSPLLFLSCTVSNIDVNGCLAFKIVYLISFSGQSLLENYI